MNILLLTPFFPYPADSGGNTRTFNLLKQMSSRDIRIILGLITAEPVTQKDWDEFHHLLPHVKTIRLPYTNRKRDKAAYFALNLIGADRSFCYCDAKRQIRRLIETEHIDIIHTDYSQAARFLPGKVGVPSVLAYIEFRTRVLEREAAIATRSLKKYLPRFFMRHEELSHTSRYDAFICMSEEDRKWLLDRRPGLKTYVVENGVDTKTHRFTPPTNGIRGLYYLGWFTNQQNGYALDFFLDHVWPRIRNDIPDFFVAGKDLDRSRCQRLERIGIPYLGFVDSDELRQQTEGHALVVPLLSGSGTRLKILEAMAMGNPVVSTAVGAEGLEAENETHFLRADTAQDFARQLLRLLRDPRLAERLSRQARSFVEERYDWSILGRKLFDLYTSLSMTSRQNSNG